MYLSGWCSPEILRCMFVANRASGCGGAIALFSGTRLTLTECTFSGNTAVERGGGAISCCESRAHAERCTFYANSAPSGSGVECRRYYEPTELSLEHCVVAEGVLGEAISCLGGAVAALRCCDVFGNEGGDWVGCLAEQYGMDGNIWGNPWFCNAPGGDFRLWSTSPCAPPWTQTPECGRIGAHDVGCFGHTHSVRPDGTGDFPTIQEAIDAAQDCDVVELQAQHGEPFVGHGNRDIDFRGKAIVVRSWRSNPYDCIVDCEGNLEEPHHGFHFQDGEDNASLLVGIGITGGYDNYGGAIRCEDAAPRFRNCMLFTNTAVVTGGGLHSVNLSSLPGPISEHCTISRNAAPAGGGLYCGATSQIAVYHTIVDSSLQGESVACLGDAGARLSHCDVVGNDGGDWEGVHCIEEQYDGRYESNFRADPCYCPPRGNYHLYNYSPCAQSVLVGALGVGCEVPQGASIGSAPPSSTTRVRMITVGPSPFTTETRILYATSGCPGGSPVFLEVWNATGRRVRTLVDQCCPPGPRSIVWDGTDGSGRPLQGGVYFWRLSVGAEHHAGRFLLLR